MPATVGILQYHEYLQIMFQEFSYFLFFVNINRDKCSLNRLTVAFIYVLDRSNSRQFVGNVPLVSPVSKYELDHVNFSVHEATISKLICGREWESIFFAFGFPHSCPFFVISVLFCPCMHINYFF